MRLPEGEKEGEESSEELSVSGFLPPPLALMV
jgi:hypothetical protein